MVGRSNVGKSSLINALLRQRVARTSAAPGKTRLANLFRVRRGSAAPFYLVDLPGYGFARGGVESSHEFEALAQAYFGARERPRKGGPIGEDGEPMPQVAALLLVDMRHPGLVNDRDAWQWLQASVASTAIVGTKCDKLPRGQRIRATRELESVFEQSVLPVSAVTGEGLDELWKLIDRLWNNSPAPNPPSSPRPPRPTGPPPKRSSGSTSRR
jgi:GTP-binding protein